MDRREIVEALTALVSELESQSVSAEMYVVGGAAIALAFDERRATRDIDAVFEPKAIVYEAAARTTIGHVTEEAGVSRSAFYGQFESKEECFLATYDLAAGWLCERVEGAVAEDERWSSRVSAGISQALRLLAANPPLAHLIAVEALQAGAAARHRRQACINRLAEALRAGRPRFRPAAVPRAPPRSRGAADRRRARAHRPLRRRRPRRASLRRDRRAGPVSVDPLSRLGGDQADRKPGRLRPSALATLAILFEVKPDRN